MSVPHIEQYQQQGAANSIPNGRPVQAPAPSISLFTFLSIALRALSGHALKWAGLLLAFALFAWIVVTPPTPAWAKLASAGSFGVMVLVLWIKKGER